MYFFGNTYFGPQSYICDCKKPDGKATEAISHKQFSEDKVRLKISYGTGVYADRFNLQLLSGPQDIYQIPATSMQEPGFRHQEVKIFNQDSPKPMVKTDIT